MKNVFKRILSGVLSVVTAFTAMDITGFVQTVSAAGVRAISWGFLGGDYGYTSIFGVYNGSYSSYGGGPLSGSGRAATHPYAAPKNINGYWSGTHDLYWYTDSLGTKFSRTTGKLPLIEVDMGQTNNPIGYCIQIDSSFPKSGSTYGLTSSVSGGTASVKNDTTTMKWLGAVLSYGYQSGQKPRYAYGSDTYIEGYGFNGYKMSQRSFVNLAATQILIWNIAAEKMYGTSWFNKSTSGVTSGSTEEIALIALTENMGNLKTLVKDCYKAIKRDAYYSINLDTSGNKYMSESGTNTYTYTINRSGMGLFDWGSAVKSISGLTCSVSGDKVTFTYKGTVSSDKNFTITAQQSVSAKNATLYSSEESNYQHVATIATGSNSRTMKLSIDVPETGNLDIVKTAADGKISGITFYVNPSTPTTHPSSLSSMKSYRTESDGHILIEDLNSGQYTIYEKVPTGYTSKLSSSGSAIPTIVIDGVTLAYQVVTVSTGKTATAKFYNAPQYGNLKIKKTASDGEISGIKFYVIKGTPYTSPNVSASYFTNGYTTDENGYINISTNLQAGWYTIYEEVPNAYSASGTGVKSFTTTSGQVYAYKYLNIAGNTTTEVEFTNKAEPGNLKIIKTADDNKVSGIEMYVVKGGPGLPTFSLTGATKYVTGSDGCVDVPNLQAGVFYSVFEKVPDGYITSPSSPIPGYAFRAVKVHAGQTAEVSFHNTPTDGKIKIIKTADDGHVEGITFTVRKCEFDNRGRFRGYTLIGEYTTNEDGEILTGDLGYGTYLITEKVPTGYTAEVQSKTVQVGYGRTVTVRFSNTVDKGKLKIVKFSEDGQVSGIQFIVEKVEGEGSSMTYKAIEGSPFTTSLTGQILIEDLIPGMYRVTEITPDIYVKQDPVFVLVEASNTLTGSGSGNDPIKPGINPPISTAAIIDGSTTGGNLIGGGLIGGITADGEEGVTKVTFYNELDKGSLKIIKTSENGVIKGFKFNVYKGTDASGEFIGRYTTNAQGIILIGDLIPGKYYVKEEDSEGYEPTEGQVGTVIKGQSAGEPLEFSFYNEVTPGSIEIIKTSEKNTYTGVNTVAGFDFKIYEGNSASGKLLGTYRSTSTGKILIGDLKPGTYYIEEVQKAGYKAQDGKVVTIPFNPTKPVEVSFYNELEKGELEIVKTSENGVVDGFKFNVYMGSSAVASKLVGTYTSANGGKISIPNLYPGDYFVKEVDKDGYVPTVGKKVTVKANEKATVSFYNELERGHIELIKTSENNKVNGFEFKIYKGTNTSGQLIGTYSTDNGGKILVNDLLPGKYYVIETKKAGYETLDGKVVDVIRDTVSKPTDNKVEFHNTNERGDLVLYKTFTWSDGVNEKNIDAQILASIVNDITFTLRGTSTTGETVNLSAKLKKNANGKYYVEFRDVLVGSYTLSEKLGTTASKYLVPMEDRYVTIDYKGERNENADNEVKTGNLSFIKVVEYGNVDNIRFNLKGTSDLGIPIDITVSVTDKTTSQNTQWMGTINGVKQYGTATTTVTNGKVVFSNIPVGHYTLTESQTDEYYVIMQAKTNVEVITDATVDYTGKLNGNAEIVNDLKRGSVKVVKTSENGVVSGILFRLSGISDAGMQIVLEARTNAQGIAKFDDIPIGSHYVIEEVEAPGYFIPLKLVNDVYVGYNETTTVNVHNYDKRGDLELTKTIENSKYGNNMLSGFKFRLHGTSDSGEAVDIVKTTDAQGKVTFKDVLIGTYTLEEVETPDRYVVPAKQTVTIHWNGKDENGKVVDTAQNNLPVAKAAFKNELKYFSVEVVKVDSEKGTPQSDAVLSGAVYGIYDNGVLVDTYTTDVNGRFTTKEYECGDKWTIKEITPSEGYLLDTTVYHVGAEVTKYKLHNGNKAPTITSKEVVIRSDFTVVKTTGEGTGIFEFEVGAKFEVFLSKAGSYANANADERDILTIGEDGTATTKKLPYGVYTVHQIKAWEGNAFAADFTVYVGQENNDHKIIPVNNGSFSSRVRVVKVDGETSKAIKLSGAGFQIYDPNGNKIVQKFTYPVYTEIDTFYTDENGEFMLPESLDYGRGYSLVEVQAPYGYVLNTEPLYFDVTSENFVYENDIAIIEVTFVDNPQKGTIKVNKSGEIFSSVYFDNVLYQPIYNVEALADAVYAIYAAEDIYTADGTLRYAKGTEVDRITTNAQGTAISKPLYLGNYEIVEVKAPYGMLIDSTPMAVTINYADQTVEVYDTTSASFIDDRQTLSLNLSKVLEIDELFGLGMHDEILAVSFGLFASEDLVANDGTVIPKGGLIEVQYCNNDGNILFTSDLPFGKYYVQELSTDEHYVLSGEKFEVTFEYMGQNTSVVEIAVNGGNAITNKLIYGTVGGIKVDSETGLGLGGAVIGIFPVGTTVFTEETAYMVTTTNSKGKFTFENIPYSEYIVREITAPHKYVLSDEEYTIVVDEDGQVIEVTIGNKPIYGDIELSKVDVDYSDKHLSGATFGVWADTNENGVYDEEDEYLGNMLYEGNGVYSYRHIKYGQYFVKEIEAPEGYILDEATYIMFIENDGDVLTVMNSADGTFGNKHKPEIGTTAIINDSKYDAAWGEVTINDIVSYKYLYAGKEYRITGILMDKLTGKPIMINGQMVTSTVTFIPETINGEVLVNFTFDASLLETTTDIVVFETLYEGEFEWVAHEDLEDEGQTVRIYKPEIGTTATIDGDKEVNATGPITITDTVHYEGLVVGETYILHGILMDAATGNPLLVNGNTVESIVEFVAKTPEGDVLVEFTYDASVFDDMQTVVVFEDIYFGSLKIGTHADITDKGQTIKVHRPDIETTATNEEGEKDVFGVGTVTIVDVVHYHDLMVGKEYVISGVLIDKDTGKPFLVGGEEVVATTTFIAGSEDGDVEVIFTFDASGIVANKQLVAFEELYEGDRKLTVHTDIDDESQTITVHKPQIGTTATVGDNEKEVIAVGTITIVDTVNYEDLIPGKEYTVSGVLMNQATGEVFLVNGKPVIGSTIFTAESESGEVVVEFTFDASGITENINLVVFEDLYLGNLKIAIHADISDRGQTVLIRKPVIGTTATVNEGEKETIAAGEITIVDTVDYKDLVVGKDYVVSGVLMNKLTGKEFLVNGRPVTSTTTFTATSIAGSVNVIFTFDGSVITENTNLVVFETLLHDGMAVTTHTDINDLGQTILVRKPVIGTIATTNGEKETIAAGDITIVDKVSYKDLVAGKEYFVVGTLMNKVTGEAFIVNGHQVISSATFTTTGTSGTVDVVFTFDGYSITENTELVVFETLYSGTNVAATHNDITDIGQTVTVYKPVIGTTATTEGEKETFAVGTVTIEDIVKYHDLLVGKEYLVQGTLMDKATGTEFIVNGRPVTAETTFVAESTDGEVVVTFVFDATGITENMEIVAFEEMYWNGIEFAVHADIDDRDQTIVLKVPEISTVATVNDTKDVFNASEFTIKDIVSYSNLIANKEYFVSGILMNQSTGEALVVNGQTVTANTTFVAVDTDGEVEVAFTVDGTAITENTEITVFETLYIGETELTNHTDLTDENQTVTVHAPTIGTTATVGDGEKEIGAAGIITIEDVVKYHDLIIGKEYTVNGILYDKSTGEAFLVDGKPVEGTTTFIAETTDGEVTVTFTFDATGIVTDTSLVAFEEMYSGGIEIAVHADISDEDQTVNVNVPTIGTTATVGNAEKETFAGGEIIVVDEVAYTNLIVGTTYTVQGILMDKVTGEAFIVNDSPVTAETTFVAESAEGVVSVTFIFDSSEITENTDLVVFETMFYGEVAIASHNDIEDEGQTVTVKKPEIQTTATVDDKKEAFIATTITLVDRVEYQNLIVGKEYTVVGVLMDKVTGEELLINGERVTAEATFIAEAEDGYVDVVFEFDTSGLTTSTTVVVFETMYNEGIEVGVHADIDDEDQTVVLKKVEVSTVASSDLDTVDGIDYVIVDDEFFFNGLVVGEEYTIKGVLMDKLTGEVFLLNGKPIEAEYTFIAESTEGSVTVRFMFEKWDLTDELTLVVFEKLFHNEVEIAAHEDIDSLEQSITLYPTKEDVPLVGKPPKDDNPNTGVNTNVPMVLFIGLSAMVVALVLTFCRKKESK